MFNVYFGSSFINNKYYFQRNKKGANPSTLLLSNLPVQVSDKDGSFSLSCLYKAIYTGLSVAQKQSNNITESWTTSHLLLQVLEERIDLKKPDCLNSKFFFVCKVISDDGISILNSDNMMDIIVMPAAIKSYSTNVSILHFAKLFYQCFIIRQRVAAVQSLSKLSVEFWILLLEIKYRSVNLDKN
jgi:hypothetical protein